jgi:uncharacterized protein (DUF58 family)
MTMISSKLLQPHILASLSNLELVARTIVEGFVNGLHRSPKFGFSQEFVEYRSYGEGDDPRYIDWNVYARTEQTFIKRFQGETNTHLMLMLDASASMGFGSHQVNKLEVGKYLAAALAYLAVRQHDAIGTLIFSDKIKAYRPVQGRSGALQSVLHTLDQVKASEGTELGAPTTHFQKVVKHRGLVVLISDFYCDVDELLAKVRPLAQCGQDLILFHILDPKELNPSISESTLFEDLESGQSIEVSPEYLQRVYPEKLQNHLKVITRAARGIGADHVIVNSAEPLDKALHAYLTFREKRG